MSNQLELQVLKQQLDVSWANWVRGEGSALELATLVGLLDRVGAKTPTMIQVNLRRPEIVQAAVDEANTIDVDEIIDQLADLDEDSQPEAVDYVLFSLDELSAAFSYLGKSPLIQGKIQLATNIIRAFPEVYRKRSKLANDILEHNAPLPGDPALKMWQAVAATTRPSMPWRGQVAESNPYRKRPRMNPGSWDGVGGKNYHEDPEDYRRRDDREPDASMEISKKVRNADYPMRPEEIWNAHRGTAHTRGAWSGSSRRDVDAFRTVLDKTRRQGDAVVVLRDGRPVSGPGRTGDIVVAEMDGKTRSYWRVEGTGLVFDHAEWLY